MKEKTSYVINSGKHVSFADLQNVFKYGVEMEHFSRSSLSIPTFLLDLFRDMAKDRFAVLVRLLAEQLHSRGRLLGAETKIQLVSAAYTASC